MKSSIRCLTRRRFALPATTHNHLPFHSRRKLLVGTISLGLLLLLGAGALTQSLLTEQERSQHPAPGQMVSVGTHRLHLH